VPLNSPPTGILFQSKGFNHNYTFRRGTHNCGWIVRELARPDVGCDYQIEEVVGDEATGLQGQVQLKSRSKPVIVGDAFRLPLDKKHLEYWLGSSMPTLLVLYDGQSRLCYWQAVTKETIRSSKRNGRFIEIPFGHLLGLGARGALATVLSGSLRAVGPRPSLPRRELELENTVTRFTLHADEDEYRTSDLPCDVETISSCMSDGVRLSPGSLEALTSCLQMCSNCGKRTDLYRLLRDPLLKAIPHISGGEGSSNTRVNLAGNMAEGEYFLGHDKNSRMLANLVQKWTLDPREPGFAHALEQRMTAPALHDGPELSHSEENVTVMRAVWGPQKVETLRALRCLVCRATGMNAPRATEMLDRLQTALAGVQNSTPEIAGLQRDAMVIELVQRFEGLTTTDPRAIRDLKPLIMEILNFPLKTRYRVTTTDAGLLAFLRGLINEDQGLVAGSLDLLNAKKKLRHCRFDLNRVRKLARDYLYGRNSRTGEQMG